jgi:protein-tyrosine-phosphatase
VIAKTMTANTVTPNSMSPHTPLNVLFLCTHNSARSILAEALLNHLGKGRFKAYSAGSSPRDHQKPNPMALITLNKAGISTEGLSSKSWDVFATPDAPHMDLVITVCDNAAGEVCPYWPGQPATAHWGYADLSEVVGDEAQRLEAFRQTLHLIRRRLEIFINLPLTRLDKMALSQSARELAHT